MNLNFVGQKGDILFLENQEKYIVHGQIKFEGESYLLIKRIKDSLAENMDAKNADVRFVKEVVEGEEYSLEPVIDGRLLKTLIAEGVKIVSDK